MIGAKVAVDMRPAAGLSEGGLRRAVKIGLNRAAAPVKAAVVGHAQAVRRYGILARSIRIRTRVYPADKYVAVIGPQTKFTRTRGKFTRGKRKGQARRIVPANYAHLVERGTKRSRARPWLAPAHAASAPKFLRQVGEEIGREVSRQLESKR